MTSRLRALTAALLLAACGGDDANNDNLATAESLDALGLFDDSVAQTPRDGVIPYDVNAVLYADEAEKLRFMMVPEGKSVAYEPEAMWDYPDGTTFIKTFFYYLDARDHTQGRRLLETRIIRRDAGTWTGRTYLWNDEQTEARRYKTGKTLEVEWLDSDGNRRTESYRVPNDNECKTCHAKDHRFEPLGPRTRQLNRDRDYDGVTKNQIDHLVELGWLTGDPGNPEDRFTLAEPYGDKPLENRARAYLDANCSHCHRPGGEAASTSLDLRAESTHPYNLGICRTPVAAGPGSGGRDYDVVAGDPNASIMIFRMQSTDPELKMPELPTLTSDVQGTALVIAWIAGMNKSTCR
jgi:uncharacterized repeat protein (TIGR03806 family)